MKNQFPKKRLKYAATLNDEALGEETDPDFELSYIDIGNVDRNGRIHEIADYRFEAAPSRARRIVRDGDVIISCVRTYLQAIAAIENPPANLIVSTGFAVVRPRAGVLDARFCKYALREPQFLDEVVNRSVGVSYPAINSSDLADILIPVPPFDQQRAIADHLDRETRRIDDLIAAKLRWMDVLAEKRVATISRAISGGAGGALSWSLSPLPWLERVPSHWTLRKLGYVSRIGNGSTPNRDNHDYWEGGHYPWLNSSFANDDEIFAADEFVTHLALDECHLPLVEPNSLLMGITGQGKTRGKCAILRFEATINQHLAYITPDTEAVSAEYLQHVLNSAYDFIRDESDGAGSTKGAITCEQIGQFKIPVPSLAEQRAIVAHIQAETSKIDALRAATERSLALLRDRRAALIAEAVTGKLLIS